LFFIASGILGKAVLHKLDISERVGIGASNTVLSCIGALLGCGSLGAELSLVC